MKKKPGKKDFWDKIQSLSLLFSGAIVGLIGIYATDTYNKRQLEVLAEEKRRELAVARVQVVGEFFDRLSSEDPKVQGMALVAIGALGDEQLATRLAEVLGGEGGEFALAKLANSDDPEVATRAEQGLKKIISIADIQSSIFRIRAQCKGIDRYGTGFRLEGVRGIITTLHLVLGCETIEATNARTNAVTSLVLEMVDIDRNLSVLVSPNDSLDLSLPGLPLADKPGLPEIRIGFPSGSRTVVATRMSESILVFEPLKNFLTRRAFEYFRRRGSPNVDIEVVRLHNSLVPGFEGAPLLDDNHEVIAILNIHEFGMANLNFAIPPSKSHFKPVSEVKAELEALANL